MRTLRQAFLALQAALPAVPPGTKLSKLDVLVLATSYIAHLSHTLGQGPAPAARTPSLLHPIKVPPGPSPGHGAFPLYCRRGWGQRETQALGSSPPRPRLCCGGVRSC